MKFDPMAHGSRVCTCVGVWKPPIDGGPMLVVDGPSSDVVSGPIGDFGHCVTNVCYWFESAIKLDQSQDHRP
ncbi:Uncharacterized protein TCM_010349 [Theobroma cacao]|uniref:Uncharacterized protein n=1 Tax=Theobroma cacao TaxID=3641 RepID=A0A061EDV2_THECC|nr:Uncharacterized protein TCM_010349 [Theobroma cacao]